MQICKLFPRLSFGPEKLALTWKIFFVSVSLRSEQFRQIVPKSLSRGNTSPRRSSRLWHVFVFCFPENSFLHNAGLSISLPHWRQMSSGTTTRIKVLVGVFSSSIPFKTKPLIDFARCEKYFDSLTGSAACSIMRSSRQNDVTWCDSLQGKQVELSLARASRSQSRYVLKSSTCEQV